MSWFSTIFSVVADDFKGWFAKEIPTLTAEAKTELTTVETSLIAFGKTDLGKLAIDAVNIAQDKLTGDAAFAAAKFESDTSAHEGLAKSNLCIDTDPVIEEIMCSHLRPDIEETIKISRGIYSICRVNSYTTSEA